MDTLLIILFIVGWGFLALLLLALLSARGRDLVFKPVLRDGAPAKTCHRCRLPFLRASWKCGRCHAYMKPGLIFLFGRGIVEPILAILIIPWIVVGGIVLSTFLWLVNVLMPRYQHAIEKVANRLGSWVAPVYRRWVPLRWRVFSTGILIGPSEIDTPIDTVADAAMTLATALLQTEETEVVVHVIDPTEETLESLRQTETGIQEMWGYVSDGHVFFPTFTDRIVGAQFHGDELVAYSEGISNHLQVPNQKIEVRVMRKEHGAEEDQTSPWRFRLRRIHDQEGKYPVTWEIDAPSGELLRIEGLINTMTDWDTLPCELSFH
ncbi:hypothetical protein ACFL6R_02980 [Gemmatimonadota bacterium]